jgi:AcrR family transcriptional regulator
VIANQRRRIFDGLAAALVYHGYEDTKITDIVELAGLSRATSYEHFQGKEPCFAAAYEDGVERLIVAIGTAAQGGSEWADQVSVGLKAGLEFLAGSPPLAHLLLVESLAAARPARLEHERSLVRLGEALRPPGGSASAETSRLLAGGLVSHLSRRVLTDETEHLVQDYDLLLQYLLAATTGSAERQGAARA